ncbi:FGGY family carbohydrate kinase [Autumnicola psychrophila]|uniref:ATP:glycerol 3-phosphotransferase n=1 Tax=Autumnicola psychrophila TaxID=3075592 RepID=A0ABU3DU39_9FLAO|nr:glycerol kinase GlpK [Zunongwangia sp. F225]MDT0687229.1 glycerol kinase GlpK [Zunongwangia sp. F225]
MTASYILSVDQGTSGTKAVIFDDRGEQVEKANVPLETIYKKGGWVEQNPESIFRNVVQAVEECVASFEGGGKSKSMIKSCGISNQRETFLVWNKHGEPLYEAIVWQCKRSSSICEKLKKAGREPFIKEKTGLIIDPYFSGTKLMWLNQHNQGVAEAIQRGEAYFGTVDTWLLYKLTKGEKYLTDYTNACRTLFFNIEILDWDAEIIREFGLEGLNLPQVKFSSSFFGSSDFEGIFTEELPITAMIGDSHAAAFGEQCFSPGTAKATLGTGCSVLMNIGKKPKFSENGMVTTICWSTNNEINYALEGIIVSCGSTIEWLKNELDLFADSTETGKMAQSVKDNNGVYLVPAFSGMGAPYWEMDRKASIEGLTFDCNKNHIVRAALESIPYQIKDVIKAMEKDGNLNLKELNIDGGIRNNSFVTQFLADLLEKPVNFLNIADVSALGAAYLSGLTSGLFRDLEHLKELQECHEIHPNRKRSMETNYEGWLKAVKR